MQQSLLPQAHFLPMIPLALLALAVPSASGQASFQGLGFFPRGDTSRAQAISGDGRVVVGDSNGREFEYQYTHAFRWTAETGLVALGFGVGGYENYATGVSADGSVIVGIGAGAKRTAFRWTEELGMRELSEPSERAWTEAWNCSPEGGFIVGSSWWDQEGLLRWSPDGELINLGFLPGDDQGNASAISADGNMIVGGSYDGQFLEAVMWTPETGLRSFPGLPDDTIVSDAADMTPDGRVVVGNIQNDVLGQPFRWTVQTGLVGLGLAQGYSFGWVSAVSADGRVIAGVATIPGADETILWTAARGYRSVQQTLIDAGVNEVAGWQLFEPMGISDDGTTIVGSGYNPDGLIEAWIAHIPRDCPADFDGDGQATLFDFLAFQNAFVALKPEGDCSTDGQFDLFDFLCFANAFNAGCP